MHTLLSHHLRRRFCRCPHRHCRRHPICTQSPIYLHVNSPVYIMLTPHSFTRRSAPSHCILPSCSSARRHRRRRRGPTQTADVVGLERPSPTHADGAVVAIAPRRQRRRRAEDTAITMIPRWGIPVAIATPILDGTTFVSPPRLSPRLLLLSASERGNRRSLLRVDATPRAEAVQARAMGPALHKPAPSDWQGRQRQGRA